jgi:Dr1-associated corepressor
MGKKKGTSAFPVARIKKMMQADDDVGKIATLTPTLVGKALECMIEDILTAAAAVTHEKRGKTIQPAHLREAIDTADKFDFLRSTLARVPLTEGTATRAPRTPKSARLEPGGSQDSLEKKTPAHNKRPRSPADKLGKIGVSGPGKRPRVAAAKPTLASCASEVTASAPLAPLPSQLPLSNQLMRQTSLPSSVADNDGDDDEDYDDEDDGGESADGGNAAPASKETGHAARKVEMEETRLRIGKVKDTPLTYERIMAVVAGASKKFQKFDEPIEFAPAPRIVDPVPVAVTQQQSRAANSSQVPAIQGVAPTFSLPAIPLAPQPPKPQQDNASSDRHSEHSTTNRVSVMSLLS